MLSPSNSNSIGKPHITTHNIVVSRHVPTTSSSSTHPSDRILCQSRRRVFGRGTHSAAPATRFLRPSRADLGGGGKASAYGKCIFRDYNNVSKDMCLQDFMRLRECVTVRIRRKMWRRRKGRQR